jgi:hypothetical protein
MALFKQREGQSMTQLSLFDESPQQPEPPAAPAAAPETSLLELAVALAGERMRNGTNRKTLESWVQKYGDERVRHALINGSTTQHVLGPGNRFFLSKWEWQLFAPYEEVYASCF